MREIERLARKVLGEIYWGNRHPPIRPGSPPSQSEPYPFALVVGPSGSREARQKTPMGFSRQRRSSATLRRTGSKFALSA